MNTNRWNRLKVGDVLRSHTGRTFVVTGLKVRHEGTSRSVHEATLTRTITSTDGSSWKHLSALDREVVGG